VEASLNKRDALVDFSLVRSARIDAPRQVSRVEIVLEDLPPAFRVPSEGGQACQQSTGATRCSIDRAAPLAQGDPARYLKPTIAVPSNLGQVVELSKIIAQGAGSEEQKIQKILFWIDANIAKEAVDSFTAADVLRERRAECQGHAYLFAAFARALGIAARVVNGLVYSDEHAGFLYHTWNEAWISGRGWQPVDATFGQPHADATHLKLIEGEAPADLLPLVGLVGRLRVSAVSALARW
jgi:transglutaminase-like putative cysteine protease